MVVDCGGWVFWWFQGHGRDKRVAEAVVMLLLEDGVTDLGELVEMPPSTKESCCGAFSL